MNQHFNDNSTPGNSSKSQSPYGRWMGMVTLGLLVMIVIGFWQYSEHLIGTLDRQAVRIRELTSTLDRQEVIFSFLRSKHLRATSLNGTPEFPQGNGRVFWTTDSSRALLSSSPLPTPPQGQEYHLWGLTDSNPIHLVVLPTGGHEADQWTDVNLGSSASAIRGFAITLESEREPRLLGRVFLAGSSSERF